MEHHGEESIAVGSTGTLLSLMGKEMEILQARKSCSVSCHMSKRSTSAKWDLYDGSPSTPRTRLITSLWNDLKGLLRSPHMSTSSLVDNAAAFCHDAAAHRAAQQACYARSMASPLYQIPHPIPLQGIDRKQGLSTWTDTCVAGVYSDTKSPAKQPSHNTPKRSSDMGQPVDGRAARAQHSNDHMQSDHPVQKRWPTANVDYSNQRSPTNNWSMGSAEREMAANYPKQRSPIRPHHPKEVTSEREVEMPRAGVASKGEFSTGSSSAITQKRQPKEKTSATIFRREKEKGRRVLYGDDDDRVAGEQVWEQAVRRRRSDVIMRDRQEAAVVLDEAAWCRLIMRGEEEEKEDSWACTASAPPPPPARSPSPFISAFKRSTQRSLMNVGVVDLHCCQYMSPTPNRLSFTKLSKF